MVFNLPNSSRIKTWLCGYSSEEFGLCGRYLGNVLASHTLFNVGDPGTTSMQRSYHFDPVLNARISTALLYADSTTIQVSVCSFCMADLRVTKVLFLQVHSTNTSAGWMLLPGPDEWRVLSVNGVCTWRITLMARRTENTQPPSRSR
jgi:hypothetical protein